MKDSKLGTCFLCRFDSPINGSADMKRDRARYTLRWALDMNSAVVKFRSGKSGSPMFDELHDKGVPFRVVRVWDNVPIQYKKRLQAGKNYKRLDPFWRKYGDDNYELYREFVFFCK